MANSIHERVAISVVYSELLFCFTYMYCAESKIFGTLTLNDFCWTAEDLEKKGVFFSIWQAWWQ